MKKRKKVLHIVESFGGGVFSMLSDLLNEVNKSYDVVVAYSLRKQTPRKFKEYFDKNIKFIEVKNFTRSINFVKDFQALMEIKKIIKNEKPDIIHLHSSKAGILGRLAISGKKVRMLYNPHGFSFLKLDDSKLKRKIYWLIEKTTAMLNKSCTIVGCSIGEHNEAKKISKNAILINNGIDIEKIDRECEKIKSKKIYTDKIKVFTIGRIGYQKNPRMFNEIAEKNSNLQFTWIGEGELKEELTSGNIEITGWKNRDEVLKIINENDIFILTSLWEGLPISLLEAMYMKKICIVTNVVGNKDVIENEKNGFVCKNVDDFVNVLKKIQNNKYKLDEISDNAYRDVLKQYNTKIMCEKYIKAYEGEKI
mgnify:CR=1 FL=1